MKSVYWLVVPMLLFVGCGRDDAAPAQAGQAFSPAAHSNLAQMMRGIPFPNSNIIFDTQSQDPEAAQASADAGGATAMFAGVYGGWQAVENASLALAETANLMMIPGRLCENGRPVPVENEDYQRFTDELIEAGMAAYRAAQSRDQDAMVDVSGTVTEACANCHDVYRDKPDEADRCIP